MTSINHPDNFAGRVNLAALYITQGRRTSRAFDGCFENHDGDAVALALLRRAQKNPDGDLARNLWRYLARQSVEPLLEQYSDCRNLTALSRDLRRKYGAASRTNAIDLNSFQRWAMDYSAPFGVTCRPFANWIIATRGGTDFEVMTVQGLTDLCAAYRTELTPAGEQLVIPGCERNYSPKAKQLDLF